MEHIGTVVVESKDRSVTVPAVAHIPLFHLAARRVHPILIVLAAGFGHETLDGRREEQPVCIGRVYSAELSKLRKIPFLGHLVERFPQRVVGTEEALGHIGGIHQILPPDAPAQVVRTLRVYRILVGSQRPGAQLVAELAFRGAVVGQSEPWGNACHQSAETLHVEHLAVTVVETRAELRLHVFLQFALGHVLQHRLCHLVRQGAPILAVGLLRLGLLLGSKTRERHTSQQDGEHEKSECLHYS